MEKTFRVGESVKFTIREPSSADIDKSFEFFQGLDESDKAYLRVDVTDRDIVSQRFNGNSSQTVKRLIALVDDKIVADGAIELRSHGWEKHIAELRLIVDSSSKGKGIGGKMAEELYMLASQEKVEEIIVKVMSPHKDAIAIFSKIGFKEDVVIKNYVKDLNGQKQDLIIMRCDLEGLWKDMEDYYHDLDFAIEEMH
ncbi:GNAT family N-acetyltransferase [bacterium]|nr:GNAT family N-acetyltransferase [bacterium]